MIIREDDSLGMFIGEAERGKIRRKDMSPMGEKTSKYSAGCFYTDTSGIFHAEVNAAAPETAKNTTTLQAAMNAGTRTQWLILCHPQGVMEACIILLSSGCLSHSVALDLDASKAHTCILDVIHHRV